MSSFPEKRRVLRSTHKPVSLVGLKAGTLLHTFMRGTIFINGQRFYVPSIISFLFKRTVLIPLVLISAILFDALSSAVVLFAILKCSHFVSATGV